jgi:hypothetical protein
MMELKKMRFPAPEVEQKPYRVGLRYCRRCRTHKPVEEFKRIDGEFGSRCKQCDLDKARQEILRPLPDTKYKQAYERQGGKCAICGRTPSVNYRLGVDHCHKTGMFRGLLCMSCNWAIGRLSDDPDVFLRAASYLLDGGTCSDMKFNMSVPKEDLATGQETRRLVVLRKKQPGFNPAS